MLALTLSLLAQKYKEYNKLRANRPSTELFSQSAAPPSNTPFTKRKRESRKTDPSGPSSTQPPTKCATRGPSPETAATPRHQRVRSLDAYHSPHHAQVTPTAVRTSIGPTPQRNGYALGLFDLLTPSKLASAQKPTHQITPGRARAPDPEATPCKRPRTTPRAGSMNLLGEPDAGNAYTPIKGLATPTKARVTPAKAIATPVKNSATPARHSRTPPSTGRRHFLDAFLQTPTARRLGLGERGYLGPRNSAVSNDDVNDVSTPSSQKRGTAAARFGLAKVAEEVEEKENQGNPSEDAEVSLSPVKVRLPPKPIGRLLSELVRGLRNMEEERMDEELDLLREMEADENGETPEPQDTRAVDGESLNNEEQGVDGEKTGEVRNEAGEGSKATRVWKKKGQRRTTRNVRIQPSTAKWKPEPEWKGGVESDSEEQNEASETKQSDAEFEDLSEKQEGAERSKSQNHDKKGKGDKGKPGRPPRTISATANPNFRALKLKNKNSRARRGRFGRR